MVWTYLVLIQLMIYCCLTSLTSRLNFLATGSLNYVLVSTCKVNISLIRNFNRKPWGRSVRYISGYIYWRFCYKSASSYDDNIWIYLRTCDVSIDFKTNLNCSSWIWFYFQIQFLDIVFHTLTQWIHSTYDIFFHS